MDKMYQITRKTLEEKQIGIYVGILIISVAVGLKWTNSVALGRFIEPVIGILLYSMFCQIPFLELKNAFQNRSFFKALLVGNFIFIPLFVWLLVTLFPLSPFITIGVLLVLLTPCIDYVIVFTHLGKGNSQSILASTPLLFIFQILLLPIFLWLFLGEETMGIIEIAPFLKSFFYIILIPFVLSFMTQILSKSDSVVGQKVMRFSSWLPVPFMALTFFVVVTSQSLTLYNHPEPIFKVLPIYIAFALIAPFVGILSGRIFNVDFYQTRALSFSTGTRNSLVVLPLALSLPSPHNQLVAVVIVTQTIVELLFQLIYIQVIPILSKERKLKQ